MSAESDFVRVEPLRSPRWEPRVAKVLALLAERGPTPTYALIQALCEAFRWPGDLSRHALAAAHPRALEARGTWFLGDQAPSRAAPRTRVVETTRGAVSLREMAAQLGISKTALRHRMQRDPGGKTHTYSTCGVLGHNRRACPEERLQP